MHQFKIKVREWRARMLRPLTEAAPYILCTAILAMGIVIGYAASRIEMKDQINAANSANQQQIIQVQAEFLDRVSERVEDAVTKALEAVTLAKEAVKQVK
ncbi:hypothetical protein GUH47_18150 [Xanthomonas citri pv. citri]|nr:hypothetical protein ART_00109 [Achromobacter phage vB_Ade_ART]MBD4207876.1 hypothetical protein [Xanthomonas citri pv. citri]